MKKIFSDHINIRTFKSLFVIVAAALTYRLLLLNFRFAIGFDEVNYLKLGVSGYLHGFSETLHTYWSPFFPWLVALSCSLTDNYELAGRLASVVMGALLPLPVYFLGKLLYDKTAGLIAAAFIAFFPPLAFQATTALTEATYTFFVALAVIAGWEMLKRNSILAAVISGSLAGSLYLTRPEGIGFLLIFAGWIIAGCVMKLFLIRPPRMIFLLLALAAGFIVVSAPYLIYLHEQTGAWTISAKGAANLQMDTPEDGSRPSFRALNAENTSLPIDEVFHLGTFLKQEGSKQTQKVPVAIGALLKKYIKNLHKLITSTVPSFFSLLPLMFFGVGLLGTAWQPGEGLKNIYFLSFIFFYWFGVVPVFHINARYFAPMWPLCAVWIAHGINIFWTWLKAHPFFSKWSTSAGLRPAALPLTLLMTMLAIFSFFPELGRILARNPNSTDFWADAVELKAAGAWLREHTKADMVIMSRNHAVDFYAGNYDIRDAVTIPDNGLDRVLLYARHRQVNYLVISERYMTDYPQLAFLMDNRQNRDELELVYQNRDASGLLTVIYAIL
jgi:4-amino-4-deoxy-L-arabinose transferase-like glycosyltransferase